MADISDGTGATHQAEPMPDGASIPAPSGVPAALLTPDAVTAAVAEANIPALVATLYQLTGDESWLSGRFRPHRARGLGESDDGGVAINVQAEIRAASVTAITAWLTGTAPATPEMSREDALRVLSFIAGEDVPAEYGSYLHAELGALERWQLAAPDTTALAGLRAVIIGAGVSGIGAAVNLMRLGADVTILERTSAIGGTWNLNRYPGCGVDTASHLYSFSFAPGDWDYYYAPQPHLKNYLNQVASEYGVDLHIRFGADVRRANFDEDSNEWHLQYVDASEQDDELTADVLISAVGAFGKPSIPNLPGLGTFAGEILHSAQWSEDAALDGARVAVIGTGASAMQLVPAIADRVASLSVFQRTPQWAAPFEQFHKPIPTDVRSLLRSVPVYRDWYRALLGWILNDKIHASLQIDPTWPEPEESINAANAGHRRFLTRYIQGQIGDDPELLAKVIPPYPPFGKRMLLDNGWFKVLKRETVELVTESIAAVEPTGIRTSDGTLHECDVLVLATGFDVVHYLSGIEITGIGGQTLRDAWDGDNGRAFLGLAVTGFPNLFCFYGPNAAPGHGGSYINTAECQMTYLMDLLVQMVGTGTAAVDPREAVFDAYTEKVDAANARMIWSHPGCSTYYRNSRGRVVYTNPWRIVDFWAMTQKADLGDYTLRPHTSISATGADGVSAGTRGP